MLQALWRAVAAGSPTGSRWARTVSQIARLHPGGLGASDDSQPSTSGRTGVWHAAECSQHAACAYSSAATVANMQPSSMESDLGIIADQSNSSASVAMPEEQQDECLSTLLVSTPSKDLGPAHIGNYYPFQRSLVPEAFREFHQAFYAPRPGPLQRRGGCLGLQAEFASTGTQHLMYRRCMHEVLHALLASQEQGASRRVLLDGPPGSGKSIALAALVERLRSSGWLVVYVPSARAFTSGGFFHRRKDDSGLYDTILSAQHILKAVADVHREALSSLPRQLEGSPKGMPPGGTLLDLCTAGLATDEDAQLAVEACLALVTELGQAAADGKVPVLFAVDDYNALHWRTDYGVTTHVNVGDKKREYQHRRELAVDELALASGFRLLAPGAPTGGAHVVAAATASHGISPALWPQGAPPRSHVEAEQYTMPRYSEVETAHALYYYHERGLAGDVPTAEQVARMRALSNGNAAEVRRLCVKVSVLEDNIL